MTDDSIALAGELRPTVTRLYLALRRRAPSPGYSAAQASALATLLDHGPMRMGELASRESVRMPTATVLVDGLRKAGLADVTNDPDDGRAKLVGLTDEGRAELARIVAQRSDVVAEALAQLSKDERATLAAAAPALRALQAELDRLAAPAEDAEPSASG